MTSTPESLTGRYVRGGLQLVGVVTALAGAVSWIAGWQHGHSLTTLGLVVFILFVLDWRYGLRRGLGAAYALEARTCAGRSDSEGAATAAGASAHHFRKLAAKRPGEGWRHATMLDQQWQSLHELERHEDALPVAREAVEAWRRVVANDPRRAVDLSDSLNHVAVTLGRLEREHEAIPCTTEAISLRRDLVALHERQLAVNLSNLTIALLDGDERERALTAAEEALEIRRRWAVADPALREPATRSAEQVIRILNRLDRSEEVLRATEEWVDFERALVADDPDRVPELAEAVRRLGSSMVTADRVLEGKARWYESLELWRRLSEGNDEYRSAFATACNMIGRGLGSLRDIEESLAVFREGLTVRRALAEVDLKHCNELVLELADTAEQVRSFEQSDLARQFAAEGLAVCREHPDSITPYALLGALQELAAAHKDLGELEPAAALSEEALVVLEDITAKDPGHADDLIGSLEEHAVLLHRLGRSDDARRAELRGVELRQQYNSDADLSSGGPTTRLVSYSVDQLLSGRTEPASE